MCTFAFDLIILYGVQTAAYRSYNRQRITRQFLWLAPPRLLASDGEFMCLSIWKRAFEMPHFKRYKNNANRVQWKKAFFIVEVPPVFIRCITFYYPIMDSLLSLCWIFWQLRSDWEATKFKIWLRLFNCPIVESNSAPPSMSGYRAG